MFDAFLMGSAMPFVECLATSRFPRSAVPTATPSAATRPARAVATATEDERPNQGEDEEEEKQRAQEAEEPEAEAERVPAVVGDCARCHGGPRLGDALSQSSLIGSHAQDYRSGNEHHCDEDPPRGPSVHFRSEERRVGKECKA